MRFEILPFDRTRSRVYTQQLQHLSCVSERLIGLPVREGFTDRPKGSVVDTAAAIDPSGSVAVALG